MGEMLVKQHVMQDSYGGCSFGGKRLQFCILPVEVWTLKC